MSDDLREALAATLWDEFGNTDLNNLWPRWSDMSEKSKAQWMAGADEVLALLSDRGIDCLADTPRTQPLPRDQSGTPQDDIDGLRMEYEQLLARCESLEDECDRLAHLSTFAWSEVVRAINLLAAVARVEPYNGTSRLDTNDWADALSRAQRLADEADEVLQDLIASTRDQIADAGASDDTHTQAGQSSAEAALHSLVEGLAQVGWRTPGGAVDFEFPHIPHGDGWKPVFVLSAAAAAVLEAVKQ